MLPLPPPPSPPIPAATPRHVRTVPHPAGKPCEPYCYGSLGVEFVDGPRDGEDEGPRRPVVTTTAEQITLFERCTDAPTCVPGCANTTGHEGFVPVDQHGVVAGPGVSWDGKLVGCCRCGRVFAQPVGAESDPIPVLFKAAAPPVAPEIW